MTFVESNLKKVALLNTRNINEEIWRRLAGLSFYINATPTYKSGSATFVDALSLFYILDSTFLNNFFSKTLRSNVNML